MSANAVAGRRRLQFPSSSEPTLSSAAELCLRRLCNTSADYPGGVPVWTISVVMLAEQLVGEARVRRARSMDARERVVLGTAAVLYCAAAIATAFILPNERDVSVAVVIALVIGHAAVSRVRFEFGGGYVVPEQLVLVPMMLLGPLPFVPILIAAAGALALVPDFVRGSWSRDRWLNPVADCWPYLVPVLILGAFAPGAPSLDSAPVYAVALLAQLGTDFLQTMLRNHLLDGVPLRDLARGFLGSARVELILSPLAFAATLAAADAPIVLAVVIAPLVWLLDNFSKDRAARYAAALELNRAYRGTVMLLSDVLEFEDEYTAQHSRSVVDLVNAVADELGVSHDERQELEFAAMLHDVGKISIPKEILHKPAALTDREFEIIKHHTIEGQFMLDRVGGLLARVGEVVRSCHERWDGRGYPDGLAGENIPLAARIVFACDAYNAMTTDRPYRDAMPSEAAIAELQANTGTQFDPKIVAALVKVIEQGEPAVVTTSDAVRAVLAGAPVPQSAGAAG
jgi:HD-GYP domain-containing protein (c-di-GMP phosphodiesterase class II)